MLSINCDFNPIPFNPTYLYSKFQVSKAALTVPGAAAAGAESLHQRRRSFGTELEDSIAAFRNKNASDEAKL